MSNTYFKNHPMHRKSIQEWWDSIENVSSKFRDEIWHLFQDKNKNIRILEIWIWRWDFAQFCRENDVVYYTWIDIDDIFVSHLQNRFEDFTFLMADIVEFLEKDEGKYDIIFMAHVFEHLPPDTANRAIQLIYEHLNNDGYWVNYMPNADSLRACGLRYIDITHQSIYNTNSFEQIIFSNNVDFSQITHFNTLPAINPYVKMIFKVIHPVFLTFTKIYYYGMWIIFPKTYTSEMLSILKK